MIADSCGLSRWQERFVQAKGTVDSLPGDYRILKFICLRILRIHGKNCEGVRTIAKGVFEARIHENTEENQAFCGIRNLSHNLEVVGSNPAPATELRVSNSV